MRYVSDTIEQKMSKPRSKYSNLKQDFYELKLHIDDIYNSSPTFFPLVAFIALATSKSSALYQYSVSEVTDVTIICLH